MVGKENYMELYEHPVKVDQPVKKVESGLIKINSDLIDADAAKKYLSIYVDWTGSDVSYPTYSSCGRSLFISGGNLCKGLEGKFVELKGIGFTKGNYRTLLYDKHPFAVDVSKEIEDKDYKGPPRPNIWTLGVNDFKRANREWKFTELFRKKGANVPENLALLKLNQLINQSGEILDVKEMLSDSENIGTGKLIAEKCVPCIYARVISTPLRIHGTSKEGCLSFISKTAADYLDYMAESIGKTLGIIHETGFSHRAYFPSNIYLDGIVVDFDSTVSRKESSEFNALLNDDLRGAERSLMTLLGKFPEFSDEERAEPFIERMAESYLAQRSFGADEKDNFRKRRTIFS